MTELLAQLPAGSRVLDLGARGGSFVCERADLVVVRLDLDMPGVRKGGAYCRGDAARLPFRDGAFDLVVSNHSLEHFVEMERCLREIGRVVKAGAGLYIAVPDAGTLTDKIYRWMGKGGGHVNAFRRAPDVIGPVERLTGLRHRRTRVLYSGLSFLNRNVVRGWGQKKLLLFANGSETFLAWLLWILRWVDGRFGTRLSVYGWEFHFGAIESEEMAPWRNVCVRCGAGLAVAYLASVGAVRGNRTQRYRCPSCGGFNVLTAD